MPNFSLPRSRVVNDITFPPDFNQDWKFLDFAKLGSQVRSGQRSHLSHTFRQRLQISEFCQISDPSHVLWVVKELNLGPNFQYNSKFMDLLNFIIRRSRPCQKSLFWGRYSILLKISLFHQILSFSGPEWLKFKTESQIFNVHSNISRFCQISLFVGPEFSKMLILSQIFKASKNFWI